MRMRLFISLGLMAAVAACGGGGSPAGPTSMADASPAIPTAAASPAPAPTPTPAPTPAPTPDPTPAPQTSGVVRAADIRGAHGHSASGTARIIRSGGTYRLELGDDFRIDSGNTDVYLARGTGTVGSSDLNLGELRSLSGRQSYAMPDDGGGYPHIVLWCRPFRVPIGLGDLQ